MTNLTSYFIEPESSRAFEVRCRQSLMIIDVEGQQVADLVCFDALDRRDTLSSSRSIDYNRSIVFSTGNTLYSHRSRPMLTIIADSVGKHDFLHPACSAEMFRAQSGDSRYHSNCLDNLASSLQPYGISEEQIRTPFNAFMNVELSGCGGLVVHPPVSQAGDNIRFRAERDLVVAVSSCAANQANGSPHSPIKVVLE